MMTQLAVLQHVQQHAGVPVVADCTTPKPGHSEVSVCTY